MLTGSDFIVRRYRPHWWLRLFGIGFLAFSATGLIHFSAISIAASPHFWDIIGSAFFTVIGLVMTIHFFTTSVNIDGDVIEVQTLFKRRRFSLHEICWRREDETTDSEGKTRYIVLEPCDRSLPDLKIERIYDFDLDFEVWLGQIPTLGQ